MKDIKNEIWKDVLGFESLYQISYLVNENHKRVNEIAEMLKLHRDTVSYRIKELGIVATQKWWYDEYQIELIKDFERSPRTKYSIVESKINKL